MTERDKLVSAANEELSRARVAPGDLFIHYELRKGYSKSEVHQVVCGCLRDDDLTPCVVLRSTKWGEPTWCIPLTEFLGWVDVGEGGEQLQVQRYTYAGRAQA